MAWVTMGALAALGDVAAADLVSSPTNTRAAVDARARIGAAQAVTDALADDDTVKDAAAAALQDAAVQEMLYFYKSAQPLTAESDLPTLSGGIYRVPLTSVATALGLPSPGAGVVEVYPQGNSGVRVWRPNRGVGTPEVWQAQQTSGGWGPWVKMSLNAELTSLSGALDSLDAISLKRRTMSPGTDANTLFGYANAGSWVVTSNANADSMLNLPEGARLGVLVVQAAQVGFQEYWSYESGVGPRIFERGITAISGPVWGPWRERGGDSTTDGTERAALQHQVRVNTARARVGGKLGTKGKALIVLRFDDYHADFVSKVLPTCRARQIPSYVATTVRGVEEQWPVSWSNMQAMQLNDAAMINGHSWTHTNKTAPADIRNEIVESADYMESQMPNVAIDSWSPPGVGFDPQYGDYRQGRDQEEFWESYAGRLIMGRYGIIMGYRGGYLQTGEPIIGQAHRVWQRWTLSEFQEAVEEAIAGGHTLQLMHHPGYLDQPDYQTTATMIDCLNWLADQRDAGRIILGTDRAVIAADPATDWRHDMLPGDFRTGGPWSGTGWSFSNGEAVRGASGGALTAEVRTLPVAYVRGGARELVLRAKAAEPVTLTASIAVGSLVSKTVQFSVPGDGVERDYYSVFALPTSGGVVDLSITSSAAVTLTGAHLYGI